MQITDSGHLVFTDNEGKTQCITRRDLLEMYENRYISEAVNKLAREKDIEKIEITMGTHRLFFTPIKKKYGCANYERDNIEIFEPPITSSPLKFYIVGIDSITEKIDPIVEQVKEKLTSRSQIGIKKYNTTIFDNTDENYMQHLQDELLDGANYCQQMMRLGKFSMDVSKILDIETNYYTIGELVSKEYKKLKNDNN